MYQWALKWENKYFAGFKNGKERWCTKRKRAKVFSTVNEALEYAKEKNVKFRSIGGV